MCGVWGHRDIPPLVLCRTCHPTNSPAPFPADSLGSSSWHCTPTCPQARRRGPNWAGSEGDPRTRDKALFSVQQPSAEGRAISRDYGPLSSPRAPRAPHGPGFPPRGWRWPTSSQNALEEIEPENNGGAPPCETQAPQSPLPSHKPGTATGSGPGGHAGAS